MLSLAKIIEYEHFTYDNLVCFVFFLISFFNFLLFISFVFSSK